MLRLRLGGGVRRIALVAALVMTSCGGATQVDLFAGGGTSGQKDGGGDETPLPPDDGSTFPDVDTTDTFVSADPGIRCGSPTRHCEVGTQVCCRSGAQAPFQYDCSNSGCSGSDLLIPCDDAADCAALGHADQVCCATYDTTSTTEVTCRPRNECTQALSRAELCDRSIPNACPNGLQCRLSSQTLPTYDLCF